MWWTHITADRLRVTYSKWQSLRPETLQGEARQGKRIVNKLTSSIIAQARNRRNSNGFVRYELSLSANSEYNFKEKKLLLRKYVFLRFRAQQSI